MTGQHNPQRIDHADEARNRIFEALPPGAEWFPEEGGFMYEGVAYAPLDYVLTRRDIARLRAEAWDEGYLAGQINEHEHRPERRETNPYRKGQS